MKYFLRWSWRRNLHVPVLIALELIVVILYAYYVRFDGPLSQVRQDWLFLMLIFFVGQERWNTVHSLFNDVHVSLEKIEFISNAFKTFLLGDGFPRYCLHTDLPQQLQHHCRLLQLVAGLSGGAVVYSR